MGLHVMSSRRCDLTSKDVVDLLKTLNRINRERHSSGQHVLMWHVHMRELMEEFPTWLPTQSLGSIKTINISTRVTRHTAFPVNDQRTIPTHHSCAHHMHIRARRRPSMLVEYIDEELARTVEVAKIISGFNVEHLGVAPSANPQAAAGWMHLTKSTPREPLLENARSMNCLKLFLCPFVCLSLHV